MDKTMMWLLTIVGVTAIALIVNVLRARKRPAPLMEELDKLSEAKRELINAIINTLPAWVKKLIG
jgi:hypothetical protein